MDWTAAIEKNREALTRVLAGLFAMLGGARHIGIAERETLPATLPRHLHRAVLRLLRPAEAAVRRLVIVAARGLFEALPRPRIRKPVRKSGRPARSARGFRLFDPPSRWGKPRRKPVTIVPRVSCPGITRPSPLPRPPMPFDPIDTAALVRRLATLDAALADLPRQAKRFARWQAHRDAAKACPPPMEKRGNGRVWPLKPGRPPGTLSRRSRHPSHEVHDVLDVVHGLAIWALEPPDTS